MKNRKEISVFVRRAFLRLLPVQIAGILVGTINAFVDNVFTGQFLGTEAMAAMSFFAPVVTMIGVLFVIVSGVHILCGKHLGAGEGDAVLSLFSTEVVFLSLCCIGVSVVCILYRHPLAHLLGAQNRTAALLSDYIAGYAPGIIGLVLSGTLIDFLPLNNDTTRSYLGIGIMVASNFAMNLLAVPILKLGMFGMGAATSVSYLLSTVVLFWGFLSRDRVIWFRFGHF